MSNSVEQVKHKPYGKLKKNPHVWNFLLSSKTSKVLLYTGKSVFGVKPQLEGYEENLSLKVYTKAHTI